MDVKREEFGSLSSIADLEGKVHVQSRDDVFAYTCTLGDSN